MKTEVIGLRLPVEQVEALKKVADSRAIKVSDLVKEMVTDGLAGVKRGADSSAQLDKLAKQMKELEGKLTGRHDWLAEVVITSVELTARTRYLAQMAVESADEVVTYISTQKALDPKTKLLWNEKRAKEEERQGKYWAKKADDDAEKVCEAKE
ncbi:MAG: hypothetical protein C0464_02275 [Cyanobacteria bacterium DS2.008]|nr:hypothetical protein [Cyanobacteria bacterium DS2.008]